LGTKPPFLPKYGQTHITLPTYSLFSPGVQQQWAAYYQQLVQLYGEQQAQTYWTQLSQHQNAQQGGAPQTSQFDQQQ